MAVRPVDAKPCARRIWAMIAGVAEETGVAAGELYMCCTSAGDVHVPG